MKQMMDEFAVMQAIGDVEPALVEEYHRNRRRYRAKQKMAMRLFKRPAILAATCLFLIVCLVTLSMLPIHYDPSTPRVEGDRHSAVIDQTVWVYYLDGGVMEKTLARYPVCTRNTFLVWKHLNGIGPEVQLLEYVDTEIVEIETDANGVETLKKTCIFRLQITSSLLNYPQQEGRLLESLEKTLLGYRRCPIDVFTVEYI